MRNKSLQLFSALLIAIVAIAGLNTGRAIARMVGNSTANNSAGTTPDSTCFFGEGGKSSSGDITGAEVCVDFNGNFLPTVTRAQTLGTSTLVWSGVYSQAVTVSTSATSAYSLSLAGAYTTAQIQVSTPTAVGQLIYNSTLNNVCVSTGTTGLEQYKLVGTASTTCQ